MAEKQRQRPPQHQEQHLGSEQKMVPRPTSEDPNYRGSDHLRDRVAFITAGSVWASN